MPSAEIGALRVRLEMDTMRRGPEVPPAFRGAAPAMERQLRAGPTLCSRNSA
jgi:hypothetical protein